MKRLVLTLFIALGLASCSNTNHVYTFCSVMADEGKSCHNIITKEFHATSQTDCFVDSYIEFIQNPEYTDTSDSVLKNYINIYNSNPNLIKLEYQGQYDMKRYPHYFIPCVIDPMDTINCYCN